MTKFPLIEELGLDVELVCGNGDSRYYGEVFSAVSAESLERLLSQAPVVYSNQECDDTYDEEDGTDSRAWGKPGSLDTHTARLIGVKKIKKDSAEDFIRDWLVRAEAYGGNPEFVNRAKKILEGKE